MNYLCIILQPVVGFWENCPQTPPELHPWTPLEDFRPQTLKLPTLGKNTAGAHAEGYLG